VSALACNLLLPTESASASAYASPYTASPSQNQNTELQGYVPTSHATYSPDAAYLGDRWGISRIQAPQAWEITRGDQSVIVAVLDTGISKDNRNLADKIIAEINFTNSPTSDDLYGHGTHMAGTIAAIAPECLLMNVKVADDLGKCQPSVVAKGIIWAVDRGAKVINLSLTVKASPDLEEAVRYAWQRGAILVAAAGNRGNSEPSYPAYYEDCLAVASTNENDSLALLSSYGDWVDVAAPGFNIYSELPYNRYGYKSGTSPAAAHVSGVAALVFSVAQDSNSNGLVNDEVRSAIETGCTPVASLNVKHGVVNAFQAVAAALPS